MLYSATTTKTTISLTSTTTLSNPSPPNLTHLGTLELPGDVGHDVDGVGAADSDAESAESAAVRRVRVGADHQQARERVVLQDYLTPAERRELRRDSEYGV